LSSEQIVQKLKSDPSDSNIELAIDWIKSRRPQDKAARALLADLMQIERAGVKLVALTPWMKTSIWDYFELARSLASIEHLDWLLSLLSNYPKHKQAALLWQYLLMDYINPEIVSGACEWLIHNGHDSEDAGNVAAYLLRETSSSEIMAMSKQLLAREPLNFSLANEILKREPDDASIDYALNILIQLEPLLGCYVVPGLIVSGERGIQAVSDYLLRNRDSKFYSRILDELAESVPEFALPYVCDWISRHPRNKNVERMLMQTLLFDPPLQPYVDLYWGWTKRNMHKADIATLLRAMSLQEEVPEDILMGLEKWLETNTGNEKWHKAFLKKFWRSSRETQYQMLERWKKELSTDDLVRAIVMILERARMETLDEELVWNDVSKLVCDVIPTMDEIKADFFKHARLRERQKNLSQDPLCLGVYENDPASIQEARQWLSKRQIMGRWNSIHYYRGEILLALLTVAPDNFVVDEAGKWLDRLPEHYERELHSKVKHEYERILPA